MSDSETAFFCFENCLLIICLCFVLIVFIRACIFDLKYPVVCLVGVIIR